jgi:YD repeat-containing protein
MDRLTAMLYPGGSREQYRCDAVGHPLGYTTRPGQIRTSVFDSRNNPKNHIKSPSKVVHFEVTADNKGMLAQVVAATREAWRGRLSRSIRQR